MVGKVQASEFHVNLTSDLLVSWVLHYYCYYYQCSKWISTGVESWVEWLLYVELRPLALIHVSSKLHLYACIAKAYKCAAVDFREMSTYWRVKVVVQLHERSFLDNTRHREFMK